MRNPFDTALAAECYARGRPFYHELVVRLIRERLALAEPVPFALDAGCGTGQSARALRPVAHRVLAIDPSRPMLARAAPAPGVTYILAAAESLPVRNGSVALLTCGAAFHWFARDAFLREVRRVLRPGGAAAVYDNFFTAVTRESGEFASWYRNAFLARFPKPPRHPTFAPAPAAALGLRVTGPDPYRNDVPMTVDELVDYLVTQSNVQAALSAGTRAVPETVAWLTSEVARFFPRPGRATFQFGGELWLLRLE